MSEAHKAHAAASRHLVITQRLRQRRDDLGLTQKQIVTRLAKCGLQTTNRALSSLEHGSGLDVAKLPELATALDCTVTYLIGLTEDPHSWEPDAPIELAPRPVVPPLPHPGVTAAPTRSPRTAARAPGVGPDPGSLILGDYLPERRLSDRHPRA
jgi:transcriptional regulator with XRE-family HTH domain